LSKTIIENIIAVSFQRQRVSETEKRKKNMLNYPEGDFRIGPTSLGKETAQSNPELERLAEAAEKLSSGKAPTYENDFVQKTVKETLQIILEKTGLIFQVHFRQMAYSDGAESLICSFTFNGQPVTETLEVALTKSPLGNTYGIYEFSAATVLSFLHAQIAMGKTQKNGHSIYSNPYYSGLKQ
jgi:hypothetical protein